MAKVRDESGDDNTRPDEDGLSKLRKAFADTTIDVAPVLRAQELAAEAIDVWFEAQERATEKLNGRTGPLPLYLWPDSSMTLLLFELHSLARHAANIASSSQTVLLPGEFQVITDVLGRDVETEIRAAIRKRPGEACETLLTVARQCLRLVDKLDASNGRGMMGSALNVCARVAEAGAAMGDDIMARVADILRDVAVDVAHGVVPLAGKTLARSQRTGKGAHARAMELNARITRIFSMYGASTRGPKQTSEIYAGVAVLLTAIERGRRNTVRCVDALRTCRQRALDEIAPGSGELPEELARRFVARAMSTFGHDADTPQASRRVNAKRKERKHATLAKRATDPVLFQRDVQAVISRRKRPHEYLGLTLAELRSCINEDPALKKWWAEHPEHHPKLNRSRDRAKRS